MHVAAGPCAARVASFQHEVNERVCVAYYAPSIAHKNSKIIDTQTHTDSKSTRAIEFQAPNNRSMQSYFNAYKNSGMQQWKCNNNNNEKNVDFALASKNGNRIQQQMFCQSKQSVQFFWICHSVCTRTRNRLRVLCHLQ